MDQNTITAGQRGASNRCTQDTKSSIATLGKELCFFGWNLIGFIFGPHPGHDNDAGMLRASGLLQRLASVDYIGGKQYVLYGDQGYYNRTQTPVVPFHM